MFSQKQKKKIIWWKVETGYMFWNYTLLMLVGNFPFKKITQFMWLTLQAYVQNTEDPY